MDILHEGKIVLITGAAQGIGKATADSFGREKAAVVIVADLDLARASQTTQELQKKWPDTCYAFLQLDVSEPDSVSEKIADIAERYSRIDILVNNAGIAPAKVPLAQLTKAQWKKTLDVNLMGSVNCTIAAVLAMQAKKQGVIVSLSSMSGFTGGQAVAAPYACSKAAIECLTKAMAREYAALGIRVLAVAPGLIQTDMTTSFSYDSSTVPLQRMGTPEDVADVIVSISSDHFRYVTGTTIDINGGLLMR